MAAFGHSLVLDDRHVVQPTKPERDCLVAEIGRGKEDSRTRVRHVLEEAKAAQAPSKLLGCSLGEDKRVERGRSKQHDKHIS